MFTLFFNNFLHLWSVGCKPTTTNSEGSFATGEVWSVGCKPTTTNSEGSFATGEVWSGGLNQSKIEKIWC